MNTVLIDFVVCRSKGWFIPEHVKPLLLDMKDHLKNLPNTVGVLKAKIIAYHMQNPYVEFNYIRFIGNHSN